MSDKSWGMYLDRRTPGQPQVKKPGAKPKEDVGSVGNKVWPPPGKLPAGKLPVGKLPVGKLPAGKLPVGKLPAGKELSAGKKPAGKKPAGKLGKPLPLLLELDSSDEDIPKENLKQPELGSSGEDIPKENLEESELDSSDEDIFRQLDTRLCDLKQSELGDLLPPHSTHEAGLYDMNIIVHPSCKEQRFTLAIYQEFHRYTT